jgi:general secretion pathway protein D
VKAKFVKSVLFLAMLSMGGNLMAAEPKPGVAEQTWTVNFKDTDIVEVVKFVQEVTGKPFIVDQKVRGPIRAIANKPLNKRELYDYFLAILDVHGFTAFESDGVVRVVVNREARNMPIPTEQAIRSRDDGYITQIIQLNNISAAKVLAALRPLVPQYAHLSAYEPSNALIISDTRANIARINDLILQMDKAAVLATDVVQLRYAQATDVVAMITQLEKPDPNRGVTTSPPIVVADKRINAVIVSGDEMSRQRIKGVVESLDRPQTKNANVKVFYLNYAKAADVAKVLTGMSQGQNQGAKPGEGSAGGQTNVQADEATNSVLITADSDNMQSLINVIEQLDIRRAQVLVEAIIVEITSGANKDLGVQWMYADSKSGFGTSNDGTAGLAGIGLGALQVKSAATDTQYNTGLESLAKGLSSVNGQAFGTAFLGERTSFMGLLKMLQSDSGTNILSTPNLLTTDNTKAKISVGQKVPFKQGSYAQTGTGSGTGSIGSPYTTYNREEVGIKLEVTPHINDGGRIFLDIDQEVSSLSNVASVDGAITNQRNIKTQILTADGQTVVLGGLIRDDVSADATRVPVLGSIPLLGNLFRTKSTKKAKTNLLVFIRATVIRDDEMLVGATAEKYSAIRATQLEARRKQGQLMDPAAIPVLPELHDKPLPPPDKKPRAAELDAPAPAPVPVSAPAPAAAPVKGE